MNFVDSGLEKSIEIDMSDLRITPPSEFNFREPVEWPRWIKRFERYRFASGLSEKEEKTQVNMLLYCLGDEGEALLESFKLSSEDSGKYESVKAKFEDYLGHKTNIVFERARFLKRRQIEGEPVDVFINDLHKLAEKCKFGDLKDELIRDLIVIGVLDQKLSESLQIDDKLDLKKAIMRARQAENIHSQQSIVRDSAQIETVQKKAPYKKPINQTQRNFKCYKCGSLSYHGSENCPANGVKCHKCNRNGHYARVCRQKKVNEVSMEDAESYLGELVVDQVSDKYPWKLPINIAGKEVIFKVDTGADVSVMGKNTCENLGLSIQPTEKLLFGPGRTLLTVEGVTDTVMEFKGRSIEEKVFILREQPLPLLSRNALTRLKIINFNVNEINQTSNIFAEFPEVFSRIGLMKVEGYKIILEEGATPYAVATPRRVALPLRDKVEQELQRMQEEGIIEAVTKPTDWCAPIVVVPKGDDKVRLCVDYTELNKHVKRERWQLPSVEESLAQLAGGQIFSLLDASSGFWQVPLHQDSWEFTTFITPFGRFMYKRIPFGISSGPEVYQKKVCQIINGLEGVANKADDFLVCGRTQEEHDKRLRKLLQKFKDYGITLNQNKCRIGVREVTFLGHLIKNGNIAPDPEKIKAIERLKPPQGVRELREFLGMVNYITKFIPKLADLTSSVTGLLRKEVDWKWTADHQRGWEKIKEVITKAPVLAQYDRMLPTRVSADASTKGLGAVLEQQYGKNWKPVVFASKALSPTEKRYAQVEKEALALKWACEKFESYLLGLPTFDLLTDHKPLIELMKIKPISDLSARLQRFRMGLLRFSYNILYVPGKQFFTPDLLSREPLDVGQEDLDVLEEEAFIESIIQALPCSDQKLEEIKQRQTEDSECRIIKESITNNDWPKQFSLSKYSSEFNIHQGLLMKGCRIFIPKIMRSSILERIHEGHMGIVKCRRRAKESVWWPNCSVDIQSMVSNCPTCRENRNNKSEPLLMSQCPKNPWESISVDLLKFSGKWYMVIQDYYSRFIEIVQLTTLTSGTVISRLKNIIARHGIPVSLRSDGGTQFTSDEFKKFTVEYGITHCTSSPTFAQSNGSAEKAVDIAKRLLSRNRCINLALLEYRNTPLEQGLSPAELLYGRKLRTTLPSLNNYKAVKKEEIKTFHTKDLAIKLRNKRNFDQRKGAQELPPLQEGTRVWIPNLKRYGEIEKRCQEPRSYIVATEGGKIRRNRRDLVVVKKDGKTGNSKRVIVGNGYIPEEEEGTEEQKEEGKEDQKEDGEENQNEDGKVNKKEDSGEEEEKMEEEGEWTDAVSRRLRKKRKIPKRYSDSDFQ